METTRGGKWRACKEEECGETQEAREGGGEREFEERRYTRILFQYFKRTPGYHAYPPRVDGQYLKRTTNVARLVPLLPGERETNSSGEKYCCAAFRTVRFARLEMYGNGLPTDIDALVSIRLVPYPRAKGKESRGKMDGIAIIRVNCTRLFVSLPSIRGTRSRRTIRNLNLRIIFFLRSRRFFFF